MRTDPVHEPDDTRENIDSFWVARFSQLDREEVHL